MTAYSSPESHRHRIAVIGGGLAGVSAALRLKAAGHQVTVLEKSRGLGGRMSTRATVFGGFDHGAQYFTVRDARFVELLQAHPGLAKPWSANSVQLLDAAGQATTGPAAPAGGAGAEAHWVAVPGMNALVQGLATALTQEGSVHLNTQVERLAPDAVHPHRWQLHVSQPDAQAVGTDQHAHRVLSGFDRVIIALPAPQAAQLLHASALGDDKAGALLAATASTTVAPCWTLMLAFPHAVQPGLTTLGPQWNAARSQHHRLAWLARESSKPGRDTIERWTVQASADWSTEHLDDDAARVQAKLLKAFAEVTGIRAEPAHADVHRWRYAKTITPLGQTHVLDSALGIGLCGDWCLGHRVENAFVSGRSLGDALA
jgi:renalase